MNRMFIALTLTMLLGSFAAHSGVKVTSLELKKDGENGLFNVSLASQSHELPDVKVSKNTIEVTFDNAENFNSFTKNTNGAHLSANVLNGKAIIKAVLPYEVAANSVNVGWKNKNFEIIFPVGKTVARVQTDRPAKPVKTEVKKVESKPATAQVSKDTLNEDYLNKLMHENVARRDSDVPAKPETTEKKDEVKVQQAAIARTPETKNENFSFAGYAVKFTVFLAMVLGLFYGVVQLLKKGVFNRGKLGFLNNSQMIQVLSTTYVAPKRSLMIVKAHNQIFLVANAENGIQFLSEMTDTTGLIKEGEKIVTGANFDTNLGTAEASEEAPAFKLKENINESTPVQEEKGIAALTPKEIVKFSEELKKKAKKLRPIEFN